MKSNKLIIFLILLSLTLTGCFTMMDETTHEASEIQRLTERESENMNKLIQIESPGTIEENTTLPAELEQLDPSNKEVMAAYYSSILNSFTNNDISVEEYIQFLDEYASDSSPILREHPSTSELEASLKDTQSVYLKRGATNLNFRTSVVTIDKADPNYASFYRETTLDIFENEFFETTMVLEDNHWKFYDDVPTSTIIIGGK